MPEYKELELHVGTLVDELRQDCIIIQDYTAIGAEQTKSRVPIAPGNPMIRCRPPVVNSEANHAILATQSMRNPTAIRAEELAEGYKELE